MPHFRLDAAKLLLTLGIWCSIAAGALAHPHIFVEAESTIELDDSNHVVRIRHNWTFDPLFSSWLTQGIDRDAAGRFDQSRLDEIGRSDVENLYTHGYYTRVLSGSTQLGFAAEADAALVDMDGRLQLRFSIVPEAEAPSQARISVSVFDPQYYTAISFASAQAMHIVGGNGDCSMVRQEGQPLSDRVQSRLQQLPADVYQLPPELAAAIGGSQAQMIIACGAGASAEHSFEALPRPARTAHIWTVPPAGAAPATTIGPSEHPAWYGNIPTLLGGLLIGCGALLGGGMILRFRRGGSANTPDRAGP